MSEKTTDTMEIRKKAPVTGPPLLVFSGELGKKWPAIWKRSKAPNSQTIQRGAKRPLRKRYRKSKKYVRLRESMAAANHHKAGCTTASVVVGSLGKIVTKLTRKRAKRSARGSFDLRQKISDPTTTQTRAKSMAATVK